MNVFRIILILNFLEACTGLFLSQRPTDSGDDLPATDLAISPTSHSMLVSTQYTFAGSAGNYPYTYSIVSGTGSINSSTGVFTAPASADSVTVRVTDSAGYTADASVVVYTALAISPSTLVAVLSQSYTFTATGGVSPYTYSKVSGEGNVTAGGTWTSPGSVGTGAAVIRVTDSLGNTSNSTVTLINHIHLMFFTSTGYTADQVGGLTGADAKCQSAADGAKLGLTWKAVMSTAATNASARLTITGSIGNMAGNTIATSGGDLFDSAITTAVNYNQSGAGPSGVAVWTGTQGNGTYGAGGECGAWLNQVGSSNVGVSNQTGVGWINQATQGCSSSGRIYCISQ